MIHSILGNHREYEGAVVEDLSVLRINNKPEPEYRNIFLSVTLNWKKVQGVFRSRPIRVFSRA